jgi:hypothetical protein
VGKEVYAPLSLLYAGRTSSAADDSFFSVELARSNAFEIDGIDEKYNVLVVRW